MAVITDAIRTELTTRALEIRDELSKEMNTALRVGGLLEDMILYLGGGSSSEGDLHQGDVNLGDLLEGLRNLSNPTGQDLILIWNHGDYPRWSTISYSGGGTPGLGGTGDVTWTDLGRADLDDSNRQINISHLNNALGTALALYAKLQDLYGCTWWGLTLTKPQGASNYSITNKPLVGVSYIEFTNGVKLVPEFITEGGTTTSNYTLRIEAGEHMAHIYATGGVSALGNSSSGSGSGDTPSPSGVGLGGLLSHINLNSSSFTAPADVTSVLNGIPNSGEGATIRWDSEGGEWVVGQTFLTDIVNISHNSGNLDHQKYLQAIYNSLSGTYSYLWNTPSPAGSGNVDYLYKVGDVKANSGNTGYVNDLASGQILRYNNGWENTAFLINSVPSGASPTNSNLEYITLGNNKYSLPLANGTGSNATMGIVKASTGLSATNGVLSVNLSTSDLPSGIPVNKLAASSVTFNGASASLGSSGTITPELVIDGNTIKSKVGNQTSAGITVPFATTAGTCTGNANTATKLADTSTKTIWGQTYWSGGQPQNVQGDLIVKPNPSTSATANTVSFMLDTRNITGGNPESNSVLRMLGKNIIDVNTNNSGKKTVDITFGGENTADKFDQVRIHSKEGIYMPNAISYSSGLIIGGMPNDVRPVLYWDSQNNALALQMSDGSAASFYATGGVSALGFSDGTSSVDAMTFGNLTVNSHLTLGTNATVNKLVMDGNISMHENRLMFETSNETESSITTYYEGGLDGIIINSDYDIVLNADHNYYIMDGSDVYRFNIGAAQTAGILTQM